MFDETAITQYKQVAAPAELKERVMKNTQTGNAKKSNIRLYKTLSLAAACLVLVFAVPLFTGRTGSRISVTINGSQVTEEPMVLSQAMPMAISQEEAVENEGIMMASFGRAMQPVMSIPLTVEVSSESKIAVSGGEMQIFDATTGELLYAGTEYTAESTVSIAWNVETGEQTTAAMDDASSMSDVPYMSISTGKQTRILQLEYEETDGVWMIYQK